MPGKHAPESPRSYYVSLARALGAALGAVALMVVAVVILLSRGDGTKQAGSPTVSSNPTASRSASPRASRTPTVSPSASPTSSTLAPSKVSVRVENGTSRNGLAARTADKIRAEGYNVTGTGNAGASFAKSTIFYRPGARDEALAFQETFSEFTVLRQASGSQSALLRVVVGSDYP